MSGSGKAGNGRGNKRRRPFRRRDRDNWQESSVSERGNTCASERSNVSGKNDIQGSARSDQPRIARSSSPMEKRSPSRGGFSRRGENSRPFIERPKWVPPKMNTDPLPVPDCFWCGKPIRDISLAIADKDTGAPVHFECVTARIASGESLEKGDMVSYIGGGRFGIVNFGIEDYPRPWPGGSSRTIPAISDSQACDFKIKKIIEWENKDKRADWRSVICEHYSVT